MARYPFRINLGVTLMHQRPNFDSGVSWQEWPIQHQFVWFGVSLVTSILTNGYKVMARYPFWINFGWFCVISKKGSDDFRIPHSASRELNLIWHVSCSHDHDSLFSIPETFAPPWVTSFFGHLSRSSSRWTFLTLMLSTDDLDPSRELLLRASSHVTDSVWLFRMSTFCSPKKSLNTQKAVHQIWFVLMTICKKWFSSLKLFSHHKWCMRVLKMIILGP